MWTALLVALVALAMMVPAQAKPAQQSKQGKVRSFLVLYRAGADADSARAAIAKVGGRVVHENTRVGLATVRSRNRAFVREAAAQPELAGAASNRAIGKAPDRVRQRFALERLDRERAGAVDPGEPADAAATATVDPLMPRQWDMRMIKATPKGSYAVDQGSHAVRVGIIDTGIDASHADLRANFDHRLSRNFTRDIPLVDGPCREEPDRSCDDPADVDEHSHGTHVAGTVGAALNGIGIAGVAPKVKLVNLRAGQDSGYFFMPATIDALTYAGDRGIDVVNMSYYIDPWLYNCPNNRADSWRDRIEQQTIIKATQRAVDYARSRGVTLVSSIGNGDTDLGKPEFDDSSPDFPPGAAYPRIVSNRCLDLPTEARGVISVTALGISERKAYYSNYGTEQSDVSAPGGDYRDLPGTHRFETPSLLILSSYPKAVAQAYGELDPGGKPNTPFVVRDCAGGRCAYYTYFQGTSMAAPHAAGVAALIVSARGTADAHNPGKHLDAAVTQRVLENTAMERPCPRPRYYRYPERDPHYDAYCAGDREHNGFYGHGIVNALAAARSR